MAKCDWYDGTLSVVLPEDPERIAVRLFDSRLAPARLYVPEVETLTLRDEVSKLRGFWTHDGTWHVELPKLPEGIAVTTPDERDREVHTAMVWRYEPVRTARRVIVSNADTDHATGHCECGACGGAIDFWDKWCRHCGTKLEEDA
jgi:hypothetical protein